MESNTVATPTDTATAEMKINNSGNASAPNEKKRGFWLTAFLVLMFIANPLTSIMYLTNPEIYVTLIPGMTVGLIYTMGVMALMNVVFAVGIWTWKKWGVFGFYGSAAIAFGINIIAGLGVLASSLGLIGVLIIFLTTRSRWQHFS